MKNLILFLQLLCLVACSGGGGGGNGTNILSPPLFTGQGSITNLWVEQNIYSCLFPTAENYLCEKRALEAMGGFRIHQDYHFSIQPGPQVYSYISARPTAGDKLDRDGFTREYKTRRYDDKVGGMAKEQYALLKDKAQLELRYWYRKQGTAEFKLMKTRVLVPFQQEQLEEIDRMINVFSLPHTYRDKLDVYYREIAERQSHILQRLIPQTGVDLITEYGGFNKRKFTIRFSQEVADQINAGDSEFHSVAFFAGKLYPHKTNMFSVPTCTIFRRNKRLKLKAEYDYDAIADYPDKARGYIEIDFINDLSYQRTFAFFCSRNYDDEIILTTDMTHALGKLATISLEKAQPL